MKVPRKEDIPHKLAMYRLLDELLSNSIIANGIFFKGGTCAAMLGFLDRFSIDLDFDLPDKTKKGELRKEIYKVIDKLQFEIKDESQEHLQFFLKYRNVENERNTLKLEITDFVSEANEYKKVHLVELDRYCQAQTIETMFANKLIALKARWEEGKGIAGRDLYDIHYFFSQGYGINKSVIEDMRSVSLGEYVLELIEFVTNEVSNDMLMQDLNPLMDVKLLRDVVKNIKREVLIALSSI